MKITIATDEREFDLYAAYRIIDCLKRKPTAVIGLSTGRTTGNIHRNIAKILKNLGTDVSRVTFVGVDEVTGVPREYAGACYTMLMNELGRPLGIREDQLLMLPVECADYDRTCRNFVDEIEARGGIDLLELGLGENGHLGFNQPGTPFGRGAWHGTMDQTLETRIRKETNSPADKELGGVTLGIRDIMHARSIMLVAKGANKQQAVRAMLTGEITPAMPASVLQLHPDCEFVLDKASAFLMTDR